jgi:hypothetical protein
MTTYKIKLIEINGDVEDVTETFVNPAWFRKFMALYKKMKGLS